MPYTTHVAYYLFSLITSSLLLTVELLADRLVDRDLKGCVRAAFTALACVQPVSRA